jgi:spoIIIJ-associated protein
VRDRIFSGQDVEDALAVAAATLGLPRGDLRYVVLEEGTPGGRGLKPTLARVAVLLQDPGRTAPAPGPRSAEPHEARGLSVSSDPREGLQGTLRAVAEAGGLALAAEVEEGEDAVIVHLRGADIEFFLGTDGKGELFRALEHLLQRMYGVALQPRALRLAMEGFRERRDAALAAEAGRIAAEVRGDGRPRTLDPQNAYERRVVHLALQDEPGVTTFSVGEGSERRVTVAPAGPPAESPSPGEAGDDRTD